MIANKVQYKGVIYVIYKEAAKPKASPDWKTISHSYLSKAKEHAVGTSEHHRNMREHHDYMAMHYGPTTSKGRAEKRKARMHGEAFSTALSHEKCKSGFHWNPTTRKCEPAR